VDYAALQRDSSQPPPGCGVILPVAPDKRQVAHINWGGAQGVHVYRWTCVCGFMTSEKVEGDAAFAARMNVCEGSWCPTPFGGQAYMRSDLMPTKEDRVRWDAAHAARVKLEKEIERERKRALKAARAAAAGS